MYSELNSLLSSGVPYLNNFSHQIDTSCNGEFINSDVPSTATNLIHSLIRGDTISQVTKEEGDSTIYRTVKKEAGILAIIVICFYSYEIAL